MHGIIFFCFSLFHIQPFVHIHFIISVLRGPRRVENRAQRRYSRAQKKEIRLLCDVMICRLAKRVSPFFTCHRPSPLRLKCFFFWRASSKREEISPSILGFVVRMELLKRVRERELVDFLQ